MARIPDTEIERPKSEISLQRLAESQRNALPRHGAGLIGLCPFHAEREPPLVISAAKNLWHCLGGGQSGGTVIDWGMKRHQFPPSRATSEPFAASGAPGVAHQGSGSRTRGRVGECS